MPGRRRRADPLLEVALSSLLGNGNACSTFKSRCTISRPCNATTHSTNCSKRVRKALNCPSPSPSSARGTAGHPTCGIRAPSLPRRNVTLPAHQRGRRNKLLNGSPQLMGTRTTKNGPTGVDTSTFNTMRIPEETSSEETRKILRN